ncbi:mersacidin/lichenicidin family type 2 lantibiotic [Umezawaea sp. Da 62-37]|uniref:mersacidin/lichenicidin family type 2 lantibiotic n=1 Tax=Umezawaea sp. Da 62-37 TaxID=3075927 RepID=UPI0028F7176C|nr:mersacidin/lichenicidin family type 2 lantibiotic [Umezawaea sp. Da 62-37]WNV87265.1 mersacidin/lichenicidin family type 2 lantibiotic [Umezawaea sp. Da 62-37]
MTAPAADIAETVRLWKDPDARWELDREPSPAHPAGEITLPPTGSACPPQAHADTWSLVAFPPPSASGPCFGYGTSADDRR